MGEALTQAQRVAAERDAALGAAGRRRGPPGLDLAAIGRMFTRITERHAERMAELGLTPEHRLLGFEPRRRVQDRRDDDLPGVPPPVEPGVLS